MTRWMSEKLSPKSLCSFWYNLLTLNHKLNIWQTKFLSLQRESHLQRRTMLNSPKGLDRVKESSLAIWIMLTVYGHMNNVYCLWPYEWMIVHSREELCRLYVIIKKMEIGKSLVFLDVLMIFLQMQGPGPLQSIMKDLVQASKCWTIVRAFCFSGNLVKQQSNSPIRND